MTKLQIGTNPFTEVTVMDEPGADGACQSDAQEEAMHWPNHRTASRQKHGVEGTTKVLRTESGCAGFDAGRCEVQAAVKSIAEIAMTDQELIVRQAKLLEDLHRRVRGSGLP